MDISLHLSSSKMPSPGAPNPDFSVESASAGHPLIGSSEALGCYLGRCGEVRVDPERLRRDFCTKIVTWRKESGWSLDSLARDVGVSPSTVSLWENGKRFPNLENLVALGTVMSVPPCHFFCPILTEKK